MYPSEHERHRGVAGFVALGEEECLDLLGRETFGRVGLTLGAIPVVLPVNYYVANRAIHFRTGEGVTLKAASQNSVVTVQVDQGTGSTTPGGACTRLARPQDLDDSTVLSWASHLPLRSWAPGVRDRFVRIVPDSPRRIGPACHENSGELIVGSNPPGLDFRP